MRRISPFGLLLWVHPEPIPLAFIPALYNQVVVGLPVWQRLAGCSAHICLLSPQMDSFPSLSFRRVWHVTNLWVEWK